jgi:hypothetical protein
LLKPFLPSGKWSIGGNHQKALQGSKGEKKKKKEEEEEEDVSTLTKIMV